VAEPLNAETPTSVPLNPMGSIPVLARLVDVDGIERWVPATANRWTATHVLVCWREDPTQPRQERLCWLPARDVARQLRGPSSTVARWWQQFQEVRRGARNNGGAPAGR
jgi:hypothetical protein